MSDEREVLTGTGGAKPLMRGIRNAVLATVVALAVIYVLSGIKVIKPEEQGLVLRFGRKTLVPLLPGTHFTLPYPVDRAYVYKPNEVKSLVVGVSARPQPDDGPFLPDSDAAVLPEFLTGDENIVHIELNVQYQIGDPAAYLFRSVATEALVAMACESALTGEVAKTRVDDILTSGRRFLLARVKGRAQERLDEMEAGVALMSMNIAKVVPPAAVAEAFKDVASALEDRDRYINEAQGKYNETIPMARGEAAQLTQEAFADKNGSISRATGETARFLKTLAELRQSGAPELAVHRLYMESMEKTLPGVRKYIVETPDQ